MNEDKNEDNRIDHERFSELIGRLYGVVNDLSAMFPGRHFTPDGHMVGSIGECLVADAFALELMPASNEGFDAQDELGRRVEIKATQGKSVAFRSCPDFAIIIRIEEDGTFETCFNGPGAKIWDTFSGKQIPKNGQYSIVLNRVRELDKQVDGSDRIPRVR
jgi:hypothetical protein